jgi:hypothetical protein
MRSEMVDLPARDNALAHLEIAPNLTNCQPTLSDQMNRFLYERRLNASFSFCP